jgi:hypothetical protein
VEPKRRIAEDDMDFIITLEEAAQPPDRESVLRAQGVPADHNVPARVEETVAQAAQLYRSLARPRGVVAPLSAEEALEVYGGDGNNAPRSPLPGIIRQAEGLALFAATLGREVSQRIESLFAEGDPALACALDAMASEQADYAADLLASAFLEVLVEDDEVGPDSVVLPYSPGYCGWHVTGQRALFARLKPERLKITLNPSCLMSPLKSVSGMLVAGDAGVHRFDNEFDFCPECASWPCRDRMANLPEE